MFLLQVPNKKLELQLELELRKQSEACKQLKEELQTTTILLKDTKEKLIIMKEANCQLQSDILHREKKHMKVLLVHLSQYNKLYFIFVIKC